MFRYKNKVNGAVITVSSELRGGKWERIPDVDAPAPLEEKKTTPKKKGVKARV